MLKAWLAVLVISPLALGISETSPEDEGDSETRITLGAGTGSYADIRRGCNRKIHNAEQEFHKDAGVEIDHRRGRVHFGARGGVIDDRGKQPRTIRYVNPFATLEWQWLEIGAGYIFANNRFTTSSSTSDIRFSGHLRFGSRRGNISIRFAEALPFYSGAATQVGVGMQPHDRLALRFGLSGPVPFDTFGIFLAGDFRASRNVRTQLGFRGGAVGGKSESTISLGVSYRIPY